MADSNKTEQPTPKRLEKARKEGRYPLSRHLVSAAQFAVFVGLLSAYGGAWFEKLTQCAAAIVRSAFTMQVSPHTVVRLGWEVSHRSLLAPLEAGAAMVATMLAIQLAATRFGISLSRLTPDLGRLNPLAKVKETLRQNLPSFLQSLILIPVFGVLVYWVLAPEMDVFFRLPLQSVRRGTAEITARIDGLLWKAAMALMALGAIDLFRQHRRYINDLRMSKQDLRDEMKESEGNPEMKGRIRRIQRDRSRRRMMQEVPTATAVIVNPTHYAIAIRYDLQAMAAPVVIAKGKNYLALRIRQKATEHQVPIIENPPLAQALYASVDVGQEIPPHLYRAVAEVLAYVFRLMNRN